jgi:hypothetical protein
MKSGKFLFLLLLLAIVFGPVVVQAQQGTPHGITVAITPPSPIGGSGTIQGYYLFRCPGTCTVSNATGWVAVGALIPAASQTAATSYLDPSAGLSTNTTWQYVAETVDSNGNFSAYSALTSAVVTTFPANPNSPSCNSKVQ